MEVYLLKTATDPTWDRMDTGFSWIELIDGSKIKDGSM